SGGPGEGGRGGDREQGRERNDRVTELHDGPFGVVVLDCRLLLARGVVRRQQRVVEDEAGDVVTEQNTGVVVEPGVLAGVDAAEAGFLRGGAEAGEGTGHAGQHRRGEREVLVVAVEAGEHVGAGGADRAV